MAGPRGKRRVVPFDSPNTNTPIIIERKDEDYIFNEVGELTSGTLMELGLMEQTPDRMYAGTFI